MRASRIEGKVEEMPVANDDLAHLRSAYDAIRSGNPDPLIQLMDKNIRWIGDASLGDPPPECANREQASAVLRRAVGRIPSREMESVAISGNRILAVAHWEEGQGPPGCDCVYNLLTLEDGRIVRMEDFFKRDAAERAFRA